MPKRTRRESLLRCRKLWQTIAENPGIVKEEAYELLKWKHDESLCPACEYRKTHKRKDYCHYDCIINWPSRTGHCSYPGSPYFAWDHTLEVRYALEIVKLCDDALAKL